MIKFTVVKLAERLGTRGQIAGVEAVEGKVDWMATESWGETEVGVFMDRNSRRQSPNLNLPGPEDDGVE